MKPMMLTAILKRYMANNDSRENEQVRTLSGSNKFKKDIKTLMVMAEMYCHDHKHIKPENKPLCSECEKIVEYAIARTCSCPYQHKITCDTCTISCYKTGERKAIKSIMAYSGPRMMFRHPLMAIRHLAKQLSNKRNRHGYH